MKCGKFWNFYSVQNWNKERKVNKIDFYKFNWVFWKKKIVWCKLDGLLPKLYCERETNSCELGYCIKVVAGRKATGSFEKKNCCGLGPLEVAISL